MEQGFFTPLVSLPLETWIEAKTFYNSLADMLALKQGKSCYYLAVQPYYTDDIVLVGRWGWGWVGVCGINYCPGGISRYNISLYCREVQPKKKACLRSTEKSVVVLLIVLGEGGGGYICNYCHL